MKRVLVGCTFAWSVLISLCGGLVDQLPSVSVEAVADWSPLCAELVSVPVSSPETRIALVFKNRINLDQR